jgi:cytidylate kinase
MAINYHRLIDKVMQTLAVQQRLSLTSPLALFDQSSHPFITVERDPGSGGRPIAKLVAKRLHFEFYDDRLIEEIARSTKIKRQVLEQIDEKGRSAIQDVTQALLNPDYVSDVKYLRELIKVVLTLGYKGKAVILGRGGNFILPDGNGLRVRVTAPYKVRLQRAMYYETKTRSQAEETVHSLERDRKDFIRQYFNKDIDDPQYYDVVINTTFLSLEDATSIIVHAYKRKFPQFHKPVSWQA